MPPDSGYEIPEQSSERTRANLYAQYREQIDRETMRRARQERVIDVTASRVSLDETDAATARQRTEETLRTLSDQASTNTTQEQTQQERMRARRQARAADSDESYAYEPRPSVTGEIDLKQSPGVRGLFIDLEA